MTSQARIDALMAIGFTARQAAFLVTVSLHAGVCVARQYCEFAEIAFGQRMHEFFQRLVARGYARPHSCGRHGARFYHLNSKTLYRAIGAAGHRHQYPMSLGAAIGRLMLLDAVLADRETRWFDTDRAKSAHLHQCFVGYAAPGLVDFGGCCSASIPAELRAMRSAYAVMTAANSSSCSWSRHPSPSPSALSSDATLRSSVLFQG
jgi:hypothetical protein